jgi:hypothetical protein
LQPSGAGLCHTGTHRRTPHDHTGELVAGLVALLIAAAWVVAALAELRQLNGG